jgi:hypothetical protein
VGTREYLLTALFGAHLVAFAAVLARTRRWALVLPLSVFALLVATQLTAGQPISGQLRRAALVLAVPSLTLMGMRLARPRGGRGKDGIG